jgi:hypothetical protein
MNESINQSGTTIGYGDLTPASNAGRFFLALYAIAICNVMGGFLDVSRQYLESLCKEGAPLPFPQRKKKE